MKHFLVFAFFLVFPLSISAQWVAGTSSDNLVDSGSNPLLASDGANGAFVLYQKPSNQLLLQRYNAQGIVQWMNPLTLFNRYFVHPLQMVSDGSGGVFILWIGCSGSTSCTDKMYAQRVSANGTELWTSGGLALPTSAGIGFWYPNLATDTQSNLYIAYGGILVGGSEQNRLMKIDANGVFQWEQSYLSQYPNGTSGYARGQQVLYHPTDQALYLAWYGLLSPNYPAMLFKINSANGGLIWQKELGGSVGDSPKMDLNPSGGVGICWGYLDNFSVDSISPSGISAFGGRKTINANLSGANGNQDLLSDDNGGFFVSFVDNGSGNLNNKVKIQHFNSAGTPSFSGSGLVLDSLKYASLGSNLQMVKSATGAVIVISASNSQDANNTISLKASKVNSSGKLWRDLSTQFSSLNRNNTGGTNYPFNSNIADGRGGFIATFTDTQQGNVFLKRMNMTGTFTATESLEIPENQLQLFPNPSTNLVHLASPMEGTWVIYDALGRAVLQHIQEGLSSQISIEQQNSGTYFAQFLGNDGKIYPPISFVKW